MITRNANAAALSVRDLHKRFSGLEVLKGISIDAYEGDVISILGASGSGKSTLLRCINLLEIPDRGDIVVDGETIGLKERADGRREPVDRTQVDRIRTQLGMVFQSFNLWSHMTVIENLIEAPVHVQRRPRAEALRDAEALLEKVGIADKRNAYPAHLSGGQQQRAAIARAIVTHPAVLLADEPTGNLDTQRSREIMDLIAKLNVERGITVLMVTHEPDMAAYARRIVRFIDGRIDSDERHEPGSAYRAPGMPPAAAAGAKGSSNELRP